MSPKQTNAALLATNQVERGAEQDERNVARAGAVFKTPALAFLSQDAAAELEAAVESIVRRAPALPLLVSQRSVERWLGLPGRDYLAAGRAGAFPTSKVRRLVMAETAAVVAWITSHRVDRDTKPGNDTEALDAVLAAAGARRVGGAR